MANKENPPPEKKIGSGYELRGGLTGSGQIRDKLEIPTSVTRTQQPESKK